MSPERATIEAKDILEFERTWWRHAGLKDVAIADRFDIDARTYYARLNEVIDDPDSMKIDAVLVKRLKRLRTYRQRRKVMQKLGTWGQ